MTTHTHMAPPIPFGEIEASLLIACGYECYHIDEDAGDDGDAENGPRPWYFPAAEVWTLRLSDSTEHQIVVVDDEVVSMEIAPAMPPWFDSFPF